MTHPSTLIVSVLAFLLATTRAHAGLPPASSFVDLPDFTQVQISPDGRFVSALARTEQFPDATNIVILDLDEGGGATLVTSYETGRVYHHGWSGDFLVFHLTDKEEQIQDGVYAVRYDGRGGRFIKQGRFKSPGLVRLNGAPPATAYFVPQIVHTRPDWGPNTLYPDLQNTLHAVNLSNGRWKTVAEIKGIPYRWEVTPDGDGYAIEADMGGRYEVRMAVVQGRGPRSEGTPCFPEDPDGFQLHGMAPDGRTALVSSRAGTDRAALYSLDATTCELGEPIVSDAEFDVGYPGARVVEDGTGRTVGFRYDAEVPTTAWLDSRWANRSSMIDEVLPGTINDIVASDRAGRRYIIHAHDERDPGSYHLFDESSMSLRTLVAERPDLDPSILGKTEAITFRSSDGMALRGYLTQPLAPRDDKDGLPLVLYVHGGPFGIRDTWGYNPWTQFLASRGYAVLQVNFRGSGGHGKAYEEAGHREWGRKMQEDLYDGVRWAVDEGVADPNRVCVLGASYGGYAALMSVARSNLFHCAVSVAGISDLEAMYGKFIAKANIRAEEEFLEWFGKHVGDTDEERDRLRVDSPINLIGDIDVPVLLAHGWDDAIVPVGHSRAMADKLKGARKPVDVMILPNEGHGNWREDSEAELLEAILAFLDRHIGPRDATPGAD